MSPRSMPARANLEQLKNQAKDLLKAYRSGQPPTIARFRGIAAPSLRGRARPPGPSIAVSSRRSARSRLGVRVP